MQLVIEKLYHGTTDDSLAGFSRQLINSEYWRPGRDFGPGFYATPDIDQAREWAHKAAEKRARVGEFVRPCVLEVDFLPQPYIDDDGGVENETTIFSGVSRSWAYFIYQHRLASSQSGDPCKKHPAVVIGPMADNDTGAIVQQEIQYQYGFDWFYDRIIHSRQNQKLSLPRLGTQIAFCSDVWDSRLALTGYYVYSEEGAWNHEERKADSV